jgi:aminoglycoside phosphotransferase (APT) family kinase protein
VVARLDADIVWAEYPEKIGDRSARFRAKTASGESVFIKTLGTRHAITRTFFEHEIQVLETLKATPHDGFYAPRLLNHGNEAGIVWMETEWIDIRELLLSEVTLQPLVAALKAIQEMSTNAIVGHACPKDDAPWTSDRYWANIDDTTSRLARDDVGLLSQEHRARIVQYMNQHVDDIDNHPIRSAHGDFAPGNLTMRGDQVAVLDWESSHLDPGPIDVAHYVSTWDAWHSGMANRLETLVWKGPPEVLVLAKIERLAGRANDTYRRRRRRDDHALSMLVDLVQRDLPS